MAEIIRGQQKPGTSVLHLALELDKRVFRGATFGSALAELRSSGGFDNRMLDALSGYCAIQTQFEIQRLRIRDLRLGMILEKDVMSKGNVPILKAGTVLTATWIERLENFAKTRGVQELIDVRVPK